MNTPWNPLGQFGHTENLQRTRMQEQWRINRAAARNRRRRMQRIRRATIIVSVGLALVCWTLSVLLERIP